MANEKKVFNQVLLCAGGRRLSIDTKSFSIPLDRKAVDLTALEDIAMRTFKGYRTYSADVDGFGSRMESFLIDQLSKSEAPFPFTACLDVSAKASPFAAVGSMAMFANVTVGNTSPTIARGAGNEVKATMWSQGDYFYTGQVLFCNVGAAALTTGITNGGVVTLPALTAGKILGMSYHLLNPPGVISATDPSTTTVDVILQSSTTSAFSGSPATRLTFGTLSVPGGDIKYIDGDVTPISDTKYRIKVTVAGPGGPPVPGATIVCAIALMPK